MYVCIHVCVCVCVCMCVCVSVCVCVCVCNQEMDMKNESRIMELIEEMHQLQQKCVCVLIPVHAYLCPKLIQCTCVQYTY